MGQFDHLNRFHNRVAEYFALFSSTLHLTINSDAKHSGILTKGRKNFGLRLTRPTFDRVLPLWELDMECRDNTVFQPNRLRAFYCPSLQPKRKWLS